MKTTSRLRETALPRRLLLALVLVAAGLNCPRAAGAPTVSTNWSVGLPIPSLASGGLTNTQVFSAPFTTIGSVRVSLNITGEFNGDLSAILRHNSGAVVLLNRVGRRAGNPGGYDDAGMNVTYDDLATNGNVHVYRLTLSGSHATPLGGPLTGSWQPDGRTNDPTVVLDTDAPATALSDFNGLDPNGHWSLFIIDWEPVPRPPQLVSWGLEITESIVSPITFETPWRYLDDGSDQGTAWRQPAFNDSAWSNGLALFGFDGGYPLAFLSPMPVGGGRITYYFRTHFHWSGSPGGAVLNASNYLDDGAVFYLNGAEAGRLRITNNPVLFNSLAPLNPLGEGILESLPLSASNLVTGDNVLAVEVHQNSPGSSDVVFGMVLTGQASPAAVPPELLVQPRSQTVVAGGAARLSFTARGTPPLSYVWHRSPPASLIDWEPAEWPSLRLANAQPTHAGNYYVVVSNPYGSVTSAVAALTVLTSSRIVVGPGGVGPLTFTTAPSPSEWATMFLAGTSGAITPIAQLDATVQTQDASAITTALVQTPSSPPAPNQLAAWSSTDQFLVTRPTLNQATLLLARLQNESGQVRSSLRISYDLGAVLSMPEDIPGHGVYFSLTGLPNSWQPIAGLSGDGTAGAKTATVNLSATPWPAGADAYLLWADDNGALTDTGHTLDNLILEWPDEFIVITQQPQSQTVLEGSNVTFSVVAMGAAPLQYQWYHDGASIPGATASSYSIPNVQELHVGLYSVAITDGISTRTSLDAHLFLLRLKTITGRLLCKDGSPLGINCRVTGESFNGATLVNSKSEAMAADGTFVITVGCPVPGDAGAQIRLSTPCCPNSWWFPCQGGNLDVGTLRCDRCAGCVTPPAGLVNWWRFDELSMDPAVKDSAGADNTAAYRPMALNRSENLPGLVGNALGFDGVDDFLQVPHHEEIDFAGTCPGGAAESFTIDVWVKTTVNSGSVAILDKRIDHYTGPDLTLVLPAGYNLFLVDGRVAFEMADGSVLGDHGLACGPNAAFPCSVYVTPGPTTQSGFIADGNWHLVAVTVSRPCDGPAVGRIYVDGHPPALTFAPRLGNLGNPADLFIGRSHPLFTSFLMFPFSGVLDELEFYNRALSADEVQSVYRAGEAGKCKCVEPPKGLVGWWPADEYSFDISGLGHHGAVEGPVAYADGEVASGWCFANAAAKVRVANSPMLNFGVETPFSIDAWIRTTSSGTATIADKRDGTPGNPRGYSFFVRNGRLGVQLGHGAALAEYLSPANAKLLNDGAWYFVAVSLNRIARGGALYVDGEPVLTFNTSAAEGDVSNSGDLLIGQQAFSVPDASEFGGCIDELEIFKCALSANDIRAIWRAGTAGKCKSIPSICGFVFNDIDQDGTRDPAGPGAGDAAEPGLAGRTVQATAGGGGNFSTTTDPEGRYCLRDLPPGLYTVSLVGHPDWTQTAPVAGSHAVPLVSGEGRNEVNFGLHRAGCSLAPVVCCPTNLVGQCSGAAGTRVKFHAVATSECDPNVTVMCLPASDSLFPLGATLVHCVATDSHQRTAECNFTVTIVDTVPPMLDCPKSIRVPCLSVDGTMVSYTVTAVDTCDGVLVPNCVPPSASLFAAGETAVTCSVVDAHGNSNSCCFNVTVDPTLGRHMTIERQGDTLVVKWPVNCAAYVLQGAATLAGPAWVPTGLVPTVIGGVNCVTVPNPNLFSFFRLQGTLPIWKTNLLGNPGFVFMDAPGPLPVGQVVSWSLGYASPGVAPPAVHGGAGCEDYNFIRLSGNNVSGPALAQTLAFDREIKKGKRYKVRLCIRRVSQAGGNGLVRLRAVAFNGNLPTAGTHPQPGENLALVGVSGLIKGTDWRHITLATWRANRDFSKIALNVEGVTGDVVAADIDGVCIAEAPCDDCQEAPTDGNGNVILPPGVDPATVTYETISLTTGKVKDLYDDANCDTSVDTWYTTCPPPCATLGGWVPPNAIPTDVETKLEGTTPEAVRQALAEFESKLIKSVSSEAISNFADLCPIEGLITGPACNSIRDTNGLFGGRDIVFVHGFDLGPLFESLGSGPDGQGAKSTWPGNASEFYAGYWKGRANEYWQAHLNTFLKDKGYKNRYLIVSWATSQRLRYGAHAVLSQISHAMNYGTGVQLLDPADARDTRCFGRDGYVLVSHSTGGPVTDAAMFFASQTRSNPEMKRQLGDIHHISDRAQAHVAFHAAFGGSTFATVLLAAATVPVVAQAAAPWLELLDVNLVDLITVPLFTSVLVDLTPVVTSVAWGPLLGRTPVPVLTVAGAHHETAYTPFVKALFHAGFDDGVVTINSQCANPIPPPFWPCSYIPEPTPPYIPGINVRVFDLGLAVPEPLPGGCDLTGVDGLNRGGGFYLDQVIDPIFWSFAYGSFQASAGCVPGLSMTGMLQPILLNNYLHNSEWRYGNHYSFLQSAADHSSIDGCTAQNRLDLEEVRVVTDGVIYTYHAYAPGRTPIRLVDPAVRGMMEEKVKGWRITFDIPFTNETVTWWIWKRTYHRLEGFHSNFEADYVYTHVLR